jgi:hypothetical protein
MFLLPLILVNICWRVRSGLTTGCPAERVNRAPFNGATGEIIGEVGLRVGRVEKLIEANATNGAGFMAASPLDGSDQLYELSIA